MVERHGKHDDGGFQPKINELRGVVVLRIIDVEAFQVGNQHDSADEYGVAEDIARARAQKILPVRVRLIIASVYRASVRRRLNAGLPGFRSSDNAPYPAVNVAYVTSSTHKVLAEAETSIENQSSAIKSK